MRALDFVVYYCMQQFKTGNLNYKTALGRACGAIGFTIGSFVIILIELIVRLFIGYKIIEHYFPFVSIFIIVYLSSGTIAYYVYHNKKRYEYIQSTGYIPFKLTNITGYTISIIAFILSFILMFAATIYINDCI